MVIIKVYTLEELCRIHADKLLSCMCMKALYSTKEEKYINIIEKNPYSIKRKILKGEVDTNTEIKD